MVEILAESEVVESCNLGTPIIPSFALQYDVLVYKMLWDRKKILNISLWRIIKLSMRPATGLCPHISLHNISLERIYCIISLKPCALNVEFQHFILRFINMALFCGYH
jgi:hypothetical protein